jgi:hypothetical protein
MMIIDMFEVFGAGFIAGVFSTIAGLYLVSLAVRD